MIEMLVVLAIISIITLVVITSQSAFNRTLLLANAAYDVALTMRSAQSYGVGSRVGAGISRAGYGLSFDRSKPNSFVFFADSTPGPSTSSTSCHPATDITAPDAKAGNCAYESATDTKIADYQLPRRFIFQDFCTYSGGSWQCANSNGSTVSRLDIVFVRPDPSPYISKNGSFSTTVPVTKACITLASPEGWVRHISVSSSGEVAADASACPLP